MDYENPGVKSKDDSEPREDLRETGERFGYGAWALGSEPLHFYSNTYKEWDNDSEECCPAVLHR